LAFGALKEDGSLVTWCHPDYGGNSSSIASQLQGGIVQVTGNDSGAFAAMREDGSVVTWGYPDTGGDSSSVTKQLQGCIVQVIGHGELLQPLKKMDPR
jgi:hypothetical protein